MTFLSMTDERMLGEDYACQASFFFPPVNSFCMKRQTHFFVCRYTFIWLRCDGCIRQMATSLFVRENVCDYTFLGAFLIAVFFLCLRDGVCLRHCDCSWLLLLTFFCNRSSLRSRFSFRLFWSICSCDYPPCGKVYCLLVYHCL